ncbi:MAG: polyprenyl diphosphate synthase [Opitutales bacterium]
MNTLKKYWIRLSFALLLGLFACMLLRFKLTKPSVNNEIQIKAPLKHVAFIMDGNGRWAKQRNLARTEGHKEGAERAFDIANRIFNHWNIPYITLYAFSTENWKRPQQEIDVIFELLTTYLEKKKSVFLENKIRFQTIGNIDALPEATRKAIAEVKAATAHFTEHTFTLALNYGAREEVLRAIKALPANEIKDLTWDTFAQQLYTAGMPDPDLIVRTSGEQRLSNYLLLQAAYSEFYFTKTHWPDFNEQEVDKAIENYLQRNRRFGNI